MARVEHRETLRPEMSGFFSPDDEAKRIMMLPRGKRLAALDVSTNGDPGLSSTLTYNAELVTALRERAHAFEVAEPRNDPHEPGFDKRKAGPS